MNAVNPKNVSADGTHHASVLVVSPSPRCAGREDVVDTIRNDIR
jgi:hypothetical protein